MTVLAEVFTLSVKSGFALVAYGENQNGITGDFMAVERDVPGSALRNDELSHLVFGLTTDQWMPGEYCDDLINEIKCLQLCFGAFVRQEVTDSFQIRQGATGITYSRHGFLIGLPV